MAYSEKSFQLARRSGYAIMFGGVAILILLVKRHYISPMLYMGLCGVLTITASWLLLHADRYKDEIQRQESERRVYWGSQIGIVAAFPVLLAMMLPNTHWLDDLAQLLSRNHASSRLYLVFGFMLPILFQSLATMTLRLLAKLRGDERA